MEGGGMIPTSPEAEDTAVTPHQTMRDPRRLHEIVTFYSPNSVVPRPFDPNIIFGGDPDSSGSSPTLPPSASSTIGTQPTPLSDITSTHSHPVYHGYTQALNPMNVFAPPAAQVLPQHHPLGPPPSFALAGGPERPQPIMMGATSSRDKMEPGTAIMETMEHLKDIQMHLLGEFANPTFADTILHLHVRGCSETLPAHTVLIAKSPAIRTLIQPGMEIDSAGRRVLHLSFDDIYVTTAAIVAALRSCYGEPPSMIYARTIELRNRDLNPETLGVWTDNGLALLAAGHVLQLPDIAAIGLKLALATVSFGNVENLLSFAISGMKTPQVPPPGIASGDTTYLDLGHGTYAPHNNTVFQAVASFIGSNFPRNFNLDTKAFSGGFLGGLPFIYQQANDPSSRRVASNPHLACLRFGDFPSQPSPDVTLLSKIFLSVPLPILRHLLEHFGKLGLARSIIAEREHRRRLIIQRRQITSPLLNWEEKVEGIEPEIRIVRRWVQIEEPQHA